MTTVVAQDRINPLVYRISHFVFWCYLRAYHRYEAHGREHVPREGGCILVANHASFIDPFAAGCSIWNRPVFFLARDNLFQHSRFLKWWTSSVGTLLVDRTRGDIRALKQALDLVRRGRLLCLFPEGTRTPTGGLQPVKAGIGFLIEKSGVPVIPTYIHGTFEAFPRGARWIRPCKITVSFGKPVTPADCAALANDPDGYQKIADLVMARIAELCYG
ncbi:MAG: 1-acyl-sn-glycerol-3-phosphate acyltransferase [Lentisphaerae bacterium]|nr:1-acyl-sn-glycerol-3-phosphate acyltransferase [Lentisphaerota bacterium]